AFGQHVIGIVAGLRRQIESDGQAGLPLVEILAVERIGVRGRGVAGISAENPRFVAHLSPTTAVWLNSFCNATSGARARTVSMESLGQARLISPIMISRITAPIVSLIMAAMIPPPMLSGTAFIQL